MRAFEFLRVAFTPAQAHTPDGASTISSQPPPELGTDPIDREAR